MRIAYVVLAAAILSIPASTVAEQVWKAKNLQVLPKDISKEEIKALMKKQAEALGVDCDHCHKVPDMDLDTEHKETARAMQRMVRDINQHFFKGKPKVECMTCHRGQQEPKL
jgi:photosynthetic reaction center cytochrome c subunit